MAHVEDRWEKVVDEQRVRTGRYGSGMRWRARYVDPAGRERSRTFARRPDTDRFLATITADVLRGSYVSTRSDESTDREVLVRGPNRSDVVVQNVRLADQGGLARNAL